jgi:hypothetical protein
MTTLSNIELLSSYPDNESFAGLLVELYDSGYDIYVPGRELLLQSLTELANTETLPNTLYSSTDTTSSEPASSFTDSITSYTDQIAEQVSLLPPGYQVTIMIPQNTPVSNGEASNIVYQNEGNGIWDMIQGYQFNTPMDIAQYNEYDNDTN